MENKLLDALRQLSNASRHKDVAVLCEQLLSSLPQDVTLRYCAAIALLQSGLLKVALEYLNMIVDQYNDHADLLTKRFVAASAIQLSCVSEFAAKHAAEYPQMYSNKAARLALSIAKEINDLSMISQAEGIIKNHIPYTFKNNEGKLVNKTYVCSDSPNILQVEVTNICNLTCAMCPRRAMNNRPQGHISIEVFEKILQTWSNKFRVLTFTHLLFNQSVVLKSHGVLRLYFMGEPLMHPQFDELIGLAKAAGALVVVQTNGTLLKDQIIRKKLLLAAPNVVGISIDGISKDTYEQARIGARLDEIVEGVRLLYQERSAAGLADKISIETSTILADNTQESMQNAEKFIKESVGGYIDKIGMVNLTKQGQGNYFDKSAKFYSYDESQGYFNYPYSDGSKYSDIFCLEALTKLNVLWDGRIAACCFDIGGSFVLGDSREGVDAVWQKESTRAFHSNLLNKKIEGYPLCRKCDQSYSRLMQEASL